MRPSKAEISALIRQIRNGEVSDVQIAGFQVALLMKGASLQETAYIGMLGSRAKVRETESRLRERGFGDADIARVHSPVGLNISDGSPEEIAVSILAEILAEKNRVGRIDRMRDIDNEEKFSPG